MESWRRTWRRGMAPFLSDCGLCALRTALETDDERLIQGRTCTPSPVWSLRDRLVERACGLSFCGWQGDGLETVGEVEEFFARMCYECDRALGEAAGCRWFLNWFDETPRDEVRVSLLGEVILEQARRREQEVISNQ